MGWRRCHPDGLKARDLTAKGLADYFFTSRFHTLFSHFMAFHGSSSSRLANKRVDGEGLSTSELFDSARKKLDALEPVMEARKNRNRACALLADVMLELQQIGVRLQATGGEFEARRPRALEDEDEFETTDAVQVAHWEQQMPLADLMGEESTEEEEAFADAMNMPVEDVRVMYFRKSLEFFCRGRTQVGQVTTAVLSFVRRFRPDLLTAMLGKGSSQVMMSRKLDEQRATTSAREKRVVEQPLKDAGIRGYKGTGSTKSEEHRDKCRQAQRGNTNRRDGERRKREAREGEGGRRSE
jgi:hypothetical protein